MTDRDQTLVSSDGPSRVKGPIIDSELSSQAHLHLQSVISEGALEHIRSLHTRLTPEHRVRTRLGSGVSRAMDEKWRIHRWPRSFVEGFRDTPTSLIPTDLSQISTDDGGAEALAVAAALLPTREDDIGFLKAAREIFRSTGAVTLEERVVAAQRRISDTSDLEIKHKQLLGKIRETDASWLPKTPATFRPRPANPGRVLHLLKVSVPYRQSGYSMRTNYLIDGQRAIGLDPVAATALGFPENESVDSVPSVDVIHSTSYHRLKGVGYDLRNGPFDEYLDAYASAAAPLVAGLRPSIIHVHSGHRGYEPALVGLALTQSFDLPLVYEVRGFFESLWSRDPRWNERGEMYWRRRATETRCLRAANAVVTLSETMRTEIIDRGVDPTKVFIVPNGVDPDRFYPAPRSDGLSRALGLEGSFVFGYVSNLDHYREGHELLIEAAAFLRQMNVPAMVLIIGDGGRRPTLEKLADERGVSDMVVFTGQVPHDQVLDYYRLLDVFVVPRVDERAARLVSPLKPFEAMAAGVPMVVSDLPALSELVDSDRGMTFPAGDAEALAGVLDLLRTDVDRRSDVADRARSWVLAERRWSSLAGRYKDVYRLVINGN